MICIIKYKAGNIFLFVFDFLWFFNTSLTMFSHGCIVWLQSQLRLCSTLYKQVIPKDEFRNFCVSLNERQYAHDCLCHIVFVGWSTSLTMLFYGCIVWLESQLRLLSKSVQVCLPQIRISKIMCIAKSKTECI